jgi:hypothetical protein
VDTGGKVTILAGAGETPLDAVASVHPAMLSAGDAEPLSVPLGLYPSKDEPEDEYKKILGVVAGKPFAAKNDTKHYTNMFHGFAAARADLSNAENKAACVRMARVCGERLTRRAGSRTCTTGSPTSSRTRSEPSLPTVGRSLRPKRNVYTVPHICHRASCQQPPPSIA